MAARMDGERKLQVGDLTVTTRLRQRDMLPATFRLLGAFRARRGVEQAHTRNAVCGLAQYLEGDVAAHRKSDQGEPRRRRSENPAGDPGDAVAFGVIRDQDGA